MMGNNFTAYHINATHADLMGNEGIGRYVFLPGSDGRAKEIAAHFDHLKIKQHSRGHHLYLGQLHHKGRNLDVAAISSGMGCPSLEIIVHELFQLGAKRFLRVGTAGSLQHESLKIGDLVNAQAAVRDEQTTSDYVPAHFPAIASYEFLHAINQAAKYKLRRHNRLMTGVVHCKSSFYGREFGCGPLGESNLAYMNLLMRAGVLATEMETSALFILAQIYNHQLFKQMPMHTTHRVLAGAILGICAMPPEHFASQEEIGKTVEVLIEVALASIKVLADNEGVKQEEAITVPELET